MKELVYYFELESASIDVRKPEDHADFLVGCFLCAFRILTM